jgi:hypothetical protein
MRYVKEILLPPWTMRIGLWVSLGLYVLAFLLPVDLQRPDQKGYGLFVAGLWGFMMAIWAPVSALVGSFKGWTDVLQLWLAVLPWLANPVMWFALAHFGMGNGRQAAGRALLAALFASMCFVVPGVWYSPRIAVPPSPAFLTWAGSMLCLAFFGLVLARHNERYRVPADFEQRLTHWRADASRAPRALLERWPGQDHVTRSPGTCTPEATNVQSSDEVGVRAL